MLYTTLPYCIIFFNVANSPPNITGDDAMLVNIREENVYSFTVTDANDFNVSIQGDTPEDSELIDTGNGEYIFVWTPTEIPETGISFFAVDELEAASVHSPLVQVCACFNGGTCTEEGVPATNDPVQVLACLCDPGNYVHH